MYKRIFKESILFVNSVDKKTEKEVVKILKKNKANWGVSDKGAIVFDSPNIDKIYSELKQLGTNVDVNREED